MRRDSSPVPERPRQHDKSHWELRGSEANAGAHACLLSNGAYSIRVTDDGNSAAFLGGCCVYDCRRPDDTLCLRLNGKKLLPSSGEYAWTLSEDHAAWSFEQNGAQYAVTLAAIDGELGELARGASFAGRGARSLSLAFARCSPRPRDVESHSAYWKLGMTAQDGENSILLHRLPKGDKPGIWLCLACDHPANFTADEQGGAEALVSPYLQRVGDSNSAARGSGGHAAFCHPASGRTHSLRVTARHVY